MSRWRAFFGGRGGGRSRSRDASAGRILQWLEAQGGFFAMPFEAREFILYESRLGPKGPDYVPAAAFPLAFPA